MYYTIGTTSLTIPLGTYLLSFFRNAAANNKYDVALVGTVFNMLVLVVAALGIKLSARFQWALGDLRVRTDDRLRHRRHRVIYGGHLTHAVHLSSSLVHASAARAGSRR